MTTEPPYSEHGGSDRGGSDRGGSGGNRGPSGIAPVRAVVVLVVFVVAAIVLVAVGTRPSVSGDAAPPVTSTTAPHHAAAPTTTTTTIPPGSVKVVVANATQTNGLAASISAKLAPQGWAMQTPIDATTTEATSTVYFATGQQEPAATIATALGLEPTAVAALTAAVPVSGVSGDSIVVVVGSDLVPAAS